MVVQGVWLRRAKRAGAPAISCHVRSTRRERGERYRLVASLKSEVLLCFTMCAAPYNLGTRGTRSSEGCKLRARPQFAPPPLSGASHREDGAAAAHADPEREDRLAPVHRDDPRFGECRAAEGGGRRTQHTRSNLPQITRIRHLAGKSIRVVRWPSPVIIHSTDIPWPTTPRRRGAITRWCREPWLHSHRSR